MQLVKTKDTGKVCPPPQLTAFLAVTSHVTSFAYFVITKLTKNNNMLVLGSFLLLQRKL